jgi:hypothetical protein
VLGNYRSDYCDHDVLTGTLVCTCNTDFCNGSSTPKGIEFTAFLSLFVYFFWKQLMWMFFSINIFLYQDSSTVEPRFYVKIFRSLQSHYTALQKFEYTNFSWSPLWFVFSKLSNFQKTKVVEFGKSDEGIIGDSCRRPLDNNPEVKKFW